MPACVYNGDEEMRPMVRTIEAATDEEGRIWLSGPPGQGRIRRVLVTILDEPPTMPCDAAALSEATLADDWLRPEEDEAWSHLQQAP